MPTQPGNPLQFSSSHTPIKFNAPVSHPHMAVEHGSEVFVPDLVGFLRCVCISRLQSNVCSKGADKVWRLVENGSPGNFRVQGQIDQPAGSGPRHIAVRGTSRHYSDDRRSLISHLLAHKGTHSTLSMSWPAP